MRVESGDEENAVGAPLAAPVFVEIGNWEWGIGNEQQVS